MKTKVLLIVLLVGFTFACKQKTNDEVESDYITSYLKKSDNLKQFDWVVILPGLGCHGCIQEGEQFMKDNINNKKILFLLTHIESIKILQAKIGVKINNRINVIQDAENQFNLPSNNALYPCIVKLNQGNVESHEFQSPYNGMAFSNFQSRLASKN